MNLAERIVNIPPSATLAINAKAQELRSKGKKIISLAVGEPDFTPPKEVKEAMLQAVEQGYFRYLPVPGTLELRQAGARYFQHFYGVEAKATEIMFSNGGKQCLYNLFQVLLNPGDEVLLPAPYWVSYPPMIQLSGGIARVVPTRVEDNFKLKIEELEKQVSPRSKMLILNSPSNPTGITYTQEELEELASWAVSKGLIVISDEVYDQLVYAPFKPASLASFWQEHKESVAIVNALSKSFAIPGLRIGFVLGAEKLIQAMTKLQGQSCSNICSIAQAGALAALQGDFSFLERERQSLQERRDLAWNFLTELGLKCPRPEGAFYLFPQVKDFFKGEIKNSTDLCAYLLEEAEVALVPGIAFGDDSCLRISYAVQQEVLREALNRIKQALTKLT